MGTIPSHLQVWEAEQALDETGLEIVPSGMPGRSCRFLTPQVLAAKHAGQIN